MANSGIAIFVIFFGISLLDALRGGQWARAALWIAIGVVFWVLDRVRAARVDRDSQHQ